MDQQTKEKILYGMGFDLITALREQLEKNGSVVTGNLKRSITFRVQGNVIIVSMAGYGEYVEYGTPSYEIKPVNKKALKFQGPEGDVFAKVVHHPGIRPKPFLRPVLHRRFPSIVKRNIERYE